MATPSIRSLVRETAVYGMSTVIARSMGLILLPVLTNLLLPEEYGHLKLTYTLVAFLQLFFIFGMGSSLVRYLIGAKDKVEMFSTHFWPLLAVSTVGAVAVWLGAEPIAAAYFAEPLPGDSSLVALAGALLWLDSVNTLAYSYLRAENRPFMFMAGILSSIAVYGTLAVYLLAWRSAGMSGVLAANIAGSATAVIIFLPIFLRMLRPVFNRKAFTVYFSFGFPIIFSGLGKIVLDMAARIILDRLKGAQVVAFFSTGYQLAAVANLAVAAFTLAWKPFLVRAADSPDSGRVYARVMTFSMVILCGLFLAVSLFADDLVRLSFFGYRLIHQDYWEGLKVIPPVMASYILFGAYINFTVGCDLTGRTRYYAWTTGAAAVFNVAANLVLIPAWGMMGAAWATLFSYLIQAVSLYFLVRRIYPVRYEWGKLAGLGFITAGCYSAARLAGPSPWLEGLFVLIFTALLFAARILDPGVLRALRSTLPGVKNKQDDGR
ncbi:MAG: oligosaccharide flippase family protein [Candidatus Glassbacteria bacterium]|nr:oligosaccharide flippase family protein [Candidatus Glassbacteria bacterium]